MLQKLAERLLRPINPSVMVILGGYTMLWGLWLLAPWWDVFTAAALYGQMQSMAPEWLWGLVALLAGASTTYGAIRPSYPKLCVGAMVAAMQWFLIGVMYTLGDLTNTGAITAFTFFLYSALVYVNIRVNNLNGHEGDHTDQG